MLGGLIGLAAGLARGYSDGKRQDRADRMQDEDRAFQAESRDRTRKAWADDDSLKNDIREGDQVFSDTIKSFDRPQLAQAPAAQESGQAPQMSQDPTIVDQPDSMGRAIPQMSRVPQTLSLAQTSGVQPAAPGAQLTQAGAVPTAGRGGKPGMLNQEAPDPRVLAAMQAKTNHFLQKGRIDQYKQAWSETSQMRAQVRASEFAGSDKEYALSGDPTVYAKRIYPLIADGYDYVDSKVVPGQDGKPAVAITRRDQSTGEESTTLSPVDKFMRTVEIARDPAAVLASEAAHARKLFETNEEIRKEQAKSKIKGDEDRSTETLKSKQKLESIRLEEGLKGGNALSLAKFKGGPNGVSHEERLKYTSLFSEAGRRMGEAQRALSSLQKDPLFMRNAEKEGSPESTQLQELTSSIKAYSEERGQYQKLLANSQSGTTATGTQEKPAAAPKPATSKTSDYSNLWK